MFGLGPLEIIVIFAVFFIFFGGKLIPRLGKSLGDTLREIRHFSKSDEDDAISSQKSKLDKPKKLPSGSAEEREE
jgi:sec-independent protein translocase protein TatA